MLLFIGQRQIKEQCGGLREQEIGIQVFGRSASYDTNVDNIVRANVSELRKRIEAYFNGEGRLEPLMVELPRGSYKLVFQSRLLEPAVIQNQLSSVSPTPLPIPRVELRSAVRARHSLRIFVIGVIIVLCLACTTLWIRNRTMHQELVALDDSLYPWHHEPTVAAFWSNFLNSPQETDIVVPDAALAQTEYYTRSSVLLRDYVNRSYLDQVQKTQMNSSVRYILDRLNSFNFVTLSAMKMAERIMALDPLDKKLHVYFSREYIPSLVERDNVIFLGDPISNPFIQLIESRLNFTVDREGDVLGPIINHAPLGQEQSTYTSTASTAYCVVAYLPNPSHSGKFLLIQGTTPAATQAAEYFLLSEEEMASLREKIARNYSPYFEVLLRISQVPGTPFAATIMAYRVYPGR